MNSSSIMFTFFLCALILIASPIDGRKDPDEYWRQVMKDQPMPEPIKVFMQEHYNNVGNEYGVKSYEKTKDKSIIKEFNPIPNISVYHDDGNPKEVVNNLFVKEFDPIPNLSVYHDEINVKGDKSFVKNFEPIPNLSIYHDD